MKKTFDKPLDGQKQSANGKNDTAYIYRIPGMAEKLDRAEKEPGIPFKSLDDVAK